MFTCSSCGYKSVKWMGRCPFCEGWHTFREDFSSSQKITRKRPSPQLLNDIEKDSYSRILTGREEFDRILGGGLVEGEVILIGGEPGVGKSTLLLEVGAELSQKNKVLYISAEESPQQLALRARRLQAKSDKLYILGEDNLEDISSYIKEHEFKFIIIDSIQVVYSPKFEGSKGSIPQVRECAEYLTYIAKSWGVVVFIVGHVTKDGAIAGPKLLEHIVDCVLYFEGEPNSNYRILRVKKNRFGPSGDIGVWEMTSYGLREVKKMNELFIPHRQSLLSGSSIVCVIEGLRPILVEIQSLVTRASFGMVRRRSLGFDFNRFSLLVAIIEKRLKLPLSSEDVFLNVAGGLRITDPAADLGALMAIVSSFKERQLPGVIFIGEVGLGGEIRRVNNINLRLKEMERAGFDSCLIPQANLKELDKSFKVNIKLCSSIKEVVEGF